MNKNPAKSYTSNSLRTASPGQVILMLYDGALKFMSLAETGFPMSDPRERNETIHNNLVKAQNVLSELQSSLDMKAEGEFARTMFNLYDFMIRQLQEANIKKNSAPIKIVKKLLKQIRDSWAEMLRKNFSEAAAAENKAAANKDESEDESSSAASDEKVGGTLNENA